MKRKTTTAGSAPKSLRPDNEYRGYTVSQGDSVMSVNDIHAFRLDSIDARRPAKLACSAPVALDEFRLDSIVDTLQYQEALQVERKVKYGFGLGKKRERLTFSEIVEKLRDGDDSYYLTTQYEDEEGDEDEEDEAEEEAHRLVFEPNDANSLLEANSESDENDGIDAFPIPPANGEAHAFSDDDSIDFSNLKDDFEDSDLGEDSDQDSQAHQMEPLEMEFRVKSLLQPPLTNLVHRPAFPITPPAFEKLVTQQINLWMGSSAVSAQPAAKPNLLNPSLQSLGRYVPQGNSSGLHHDHADNLYVLIQGRKRFTLYLPQDAAHLYTVGNINKVYGNGLIDYHVDANARLWRPMRQDGAIIAEWAKWALHNGINCEYTKQQLERIIENEPRYRGPADASLDPPSFSRVPPILAHLDEVTDADERQQLEKLADREFPGFRLLRKLEVWLNAGEMLYIPTGWFHEVTSFASDAGEPVHIAMNWWFVPPSLPVEEAYPDKYWQDDFEMTEIAMETIRQEAKARQKAPLP